MRQFGVAQEKLKAYLTLFRQTRLQGDLIILGQVPPYSGLSETPPALDPSTESSFPKHTFPARYAFSQALARSTALAAFESRLDAFISSVERLPQTLSETGVPGLKRKQIIQKLGQLLKFRQGLNLSRQNFGDMPDFYWAEPVLEGVRVLIAYKYTLLLTLHRVLQLYEQGVRDPSTCKCPKYEDHICG